MRHSTPPSNTSLSHHSLHHAFLESAKNNGIIKPETTLQEFKQMTIGEVFEILASQGKDTLHISVKV